MDLLSKLRMLRDGKGWFRYPSFPGSTCIMNGERLDTDHVFQVGIVIIGGNIAQSSGSKMVVTG